MKLSFTTLSCPKWTWQQILDQAKSSGYDGIEIRGVMDIMDTTKISELSHENLDDTLKELRKLNLEIPCLDTSCFFDDAKKVQASLKEGQETIDLAQKMGAGYIRIFGDSIKEDDYAATAQRIADALSILGEYGEDKSVMPLLETHGDFSGSKPVLDVISRATNKNIGVLWDINHPYRHSNETMMYTAQKLAPYIKHVHIKDSIGEGKDAQLKLVGEGTIPIGETLMALKAIGYTGYLSFEWEKRWHEEIEEPEIALPQYIKAMKNIMKIQTEDN